MVMNSSVVCCVFYGNFKRFDQFRTEILRTQTRPHTTKLALLGSLFESLSENGAPHNSG